MYFLETLQVRAPCHGGVLISFWYWWNVVWIFYEFFKYWKKWNLNFFSSIFQVFFAFHANIKNLVYKKNSGVWIFFYLFFLEKQFFLISHFMLFSTLQKYWKVPLHLLVKWEVVSPNSRFTVGIYIHYTSILRFPCSDFVSQMWWWFGGGVCNVFLAFYAISNISRN